MSESGWYSGDTHVHRTLEELKTVQPAEDLNVSFPLTYWSWDAYQPPTKQDPGFPEGGRPEAIPIDSTHVILPMNTEFEIDRVNGKKHSLGAFFVLNHKTPFTTGVPPVKPILEKVRSEGALLELDKHNWPWSMMLVPTLGIDLYELSNNHIWQTDFLFKDFGEPAPDFMEIERDSQGQWTEKGWIQFGFQNYYLLLNCGFHLSPTAGTASGVHPVPLGYGRVYVHLKEGFSVEGWIEGLRAGRSFVTTGPMLVIEAEEFQPGHKFKYQGSPDKPIRLSGRVTSVTPLTAIELVANGRVVQQQVPQNAATPHGGYLHSIDLEWVPEGSGWFAIRCYEEREPGRIRFAHSAPYWVEIEGKPFLPKRREVEFLIGRIDGQITCNEGILSPESVEEYKKAKRVFEGLLDKVRN